MVHRWCAFVAIVSLGLLPLVLGVTPAHASSPVYSPPKQYYLALGDSVMYGYQQGKFLSQYPNAKESSFNTGPATQFWRMLKAVRPDIQLVNFACPGETSESFLHANACPSFPGPLHNAYAGTQMDAALAFLRAHPGQVGPITIDLGANDANALIGSCGGASNLACVAVGLPKLLDRFAKNLGQILAALRQAAPDAEIIVLQYYNPYAVDVPASNVLVQALNRLIAAAADATGVLVADAFTPFNLAAAEPQTLCTLTLYCTALKDIHGSDAGYLRIAQAFWDVSGYQKQAGGFVLSFSSSMPGRGMVYFGSGPGCLGLVNVATQDMSPGETTHVIHVTGNDLPGTVGNIGIIPGVTYWYELVTITSTGQQVDNNGGKCYSVTIPRA